ncbi:hypothetical protein AGMMS49982_11210 [Bacteroidia bacterium]|nr:hypothetical protein AGMMS49982_11210 [Bacteroidia bacterium]
MKKILFFATFVAFAFYFSSCDAGYEPEGTTRGEWTDPAARLPKATITGVAYLSANTLTPDGYKLSTYAREGQILHFSITYASLGLVGSKINYDTTAIVGVNGIYEVNLPTRTDGEPVNVSISSDIDTFDSGLRANLYAVKPVIYAIKSDTVYRKDLSYSLTGTVPSAWEVGTYRVSLKYSTGSALVTAPDTYTYPPLTGTERPTKVTIVIGGDQFVPARRDSVFAVNLATEENEESKQTYLEFIMSAPRGGLKFRMGATFVIGENIYSLFNQSDVIYGGTTTIGEDKIFNKQ